MRIRGWRRKVACALVAAGLLAPSAARAASLGVNLVENPGFESVDVNSRGIDGSVKILDWDDGARTGFAYGYEQGYHHGFPTRKPPDSGVYYFTPNQSGGRWRRHADAWQRL
jgi:hypothetical protein